MVTRSGQDYSQSRRDGRVTGPDGMPGAAATAGTSPRSAPRAAAASPLPPARRER